MRIFLTVVILIFAVNACYPQYENGDNRKSNYDVFYELCSGGLNIFEDYMAEYGKDIKVSLKVNGNDEIRRFITGIIKQNYSSYRILFSDRPDSNYFQLNIDEVDFVLRYPGITNNNPLGDDYLKRFIKCSFRIYFLNEKGDVLKEKNFSKEYKDEIKFASLESAENSGYSFTKGIVPEKPLISKIIVPAAVVLVSAMTIILFFAIRSK
jgi:hypothetical protein